MSHLDPKLWEALRATDGFFGLAADGKDIALRISPDAERSLLQSQMLFVLQSDCKLRGSELGLHWWRLGSLTEADLWEVKSYIGQTGLHLARANLRVA